MQVRSIRNDIVYIEKITTPRQRREHRLERQRRVWYSELPSPRLEGWKTKVPCELHRIGCWHGF